MHCIIEKIFYDLCSETGDFENNVMDITKKRLDDISRFLEYDAAVCTAIFLKEETIYICVNKRKRGFNNFEKLCNDVFSFFKMLIARSITEQNEKVESLRYIYANYKNNSKITLNIEDDGIANK